MDRFTLRLRYWLSLPATDVEESAIGGRGIRRALRVLWHHRFLWRLPIGLGFAIESLVQGFGLISLFFVLGAVVLTWDTNAF